MTNREKFKSEIETKLKSIKSKSRIDSKNMAMKIKDIEKTIQDVEATEYLSSD